MATTSKPLGSTRSLASGVGWGAVIVVYTAQKIDIENGIFKSVMLAPRWPIVLRGIADGPALLGNFSGG